MKLDAHDPRRSGPVRRTFASLTGGLVLTLIFAAVAWTVMDPVFRAPTGDLAEYLNNAYRVMYGERPYEDFWLLFPPGEVYLPAAVMTAAGGNLNAVMAFNLLQSAAIAALFCSLVRRLRGPWWAGVLTGILILFSSSLALKAGGLCYGHTYVFFLAVALIFLHGALSSRKKSLLLISGLALGLAFLFRIYLVGAGVTAIAAALVLATGREESGCKSRWSAVALLMFGPLLVAIGTGVALWPKSFDVARQLVWDSVEHGSTNRGEDFFLVQQPRRLAKLMFQAEDRSGHKVHHTERIRAMDSAAHLVVPILAWLGWAIARRRSPPSPEKTVELALLLWGTLTIPRIIVRADLPHISSVTTPLLVVLVVLLVSPHRSRAARGYKLMVAILIIVLLRPLIFTAGSKLGSRQDTPDAWASAPHGRFRFTNSSRAHTAQRIADAIQAHSQPGDPIFVTAWNVPPLYAWTGRVNPTYYDSMIEPVFKPCSLPRPLVLDLERNQPSIVVHDEGLRFGDNLELRHAQPALMQYLAEHYHTAERLIQVSILALDTGDSPLSSEPRSASDRLLPASSVLFRDGFDDGALSRWTFH